LLDDIHRNTFLVNRPVCRHHHGYRASSNSSCNLLSSA
jgi:hypothetical protein